MLVCFCLWLRVLCCQNRVKNPKRQWQWVHLLHWEGKGGEGNGKLILWSYGYWLWVTLLFVSLHHLVGISAELHVRDSPWPWEPSHPRQAQSVARGDMQALGRTELLWGSARTVGSRQEPQLTPGAHRHCSQWWVCVISHRLLQGKVALKGRAPPTQADTSQKQKKGKRMEPPIPAVSLIILLKRLSFSHFLVGDNCKSVSAVKHEWKMKIKLLDIIK